MKKKAIVICFLIMKFVLFELNAQSSETDSLENLLTEYTSKDTVRVNLLNDVAYKLYTVDIEKTLNYAKEAKVLAEKLKFKKGEAKSLRLIGIYYTMKANYPIALEYLQKSLKLNEELVYKKGISDCLNSIGIVYNNRGNKTQALKYYRNALKLYKEINDQRNISYCLNNIGVIHYDQGNYSTALDYFQNSLIIDEQLGNKSGVAIGLNNIGEIYREFNDFDKAIDYFQKSLKISEEIGDRYGICYLYKDFGSVYFKTENYSKALDYTLKSLEIAKEIDYFDIQKDIYLQLANIYKSINNYKQAYEKYVLYKELSDSVFNEENVKKITGLEYQYKYEKEKQAAKLEQTKKDLILIEEAKHQRYIRNLVFTGFILMFVLVLFVLNLFFQKRKANKLLLIQQQKINKKNILLHEQNEEIQQLNEELNATNDILLDQKEDLEKALENLKEAQSQLVQSERMASVGILTAGVAHEINNPLNFIQGSKYAIESYLEENIREHYINLMPLFGMLDEGINRASEIVRSLKSFCKTAEDKRSECNIHTIIDNCLIILHNQIKDKIEINKHFMPNTPKLFGNEGELHHVFINIFSNAVDAIKGKGIITILTKLKASVLTIVISDTGVGINPDYIEKITLPFFTTKNPGEGTGLGMSIAYNIIKEHNGSIIFNSKEGEGTTVTVSLPIM